MPYMQHFWPAWMLLFSISGLSNNIVASITKTFIYFLSKKGPKLLLLLYLNVPLFLFYVPLSMTLANRFQMGSLGVCLEWKAEINFRMQKTFSNTFKYSNIRNLSAYQDNSNHTPLNALGWIVKIISRNKTKQDKTKQNCDS